MFYQEPLWETTGTKLQEPQTPNPLHAKNES